MNYPCSVHAKKDLVHQESLVLNTGKELCTTVFSSVFCGCHMCIQNDVQCFAQFL
jgi:hypothetical protein